MTIVELREKRAKLWATMEGFLDTHRNRKGVLSAEDDAVYANMEKELNDLTNEVRRMERRDAIIDAGVTRLRPILMTSLTTILGLIVMAFGNNVGTALMQPVALVCIGGLLYATLMTLLVVPCMYDLLSRRELRKVEETDLQTLDI